MILKLLTKESLQYFLIIFSLVIFAPLIFDSCSKVEEEGKGIGPVKNVVLAPIDENLVSKGRFIFTKKCMECHSIDVKLRGPALKDVTKRRKAEWIMNLILNTDQMLKEDSLAVRQYLEHGIKMVVDNVNQDDALAVLEYLRSVDRK